MPLFSYEGFVGGQKKHKGVIQASSEYEARQGLRERGITITKVSLNNKFLRKDTLEGDELVNFTIQLAQLVKAGVPLYESLSTLEEQSREEKYNQILHSLCVQIKAGRSLSEAMCSYPQVFDDLYRTMVAAGEASGSLGLMLDRLSLLLSTQAKLKRNIISALIYPALLGTFTLVVVFLLLVFVIPSVEEIFEGRKVNRFTSIVLSCSHFLSDYWVVYIPLLISLVAISVVALRTEKGRLWLDKKLLKIPVVNTLIIQSSIARFTRTMATLQKGGVNIIESLRLSCRVIKNRVLKDVIFRAENNIVEGSTLGFELQKNSLVPKMVSRMISVGEDTGDVIGMYHKIADIYEGEVEKSVTRVMALAQPVILVVLGIIVGVILLAVLLPFTDITALSA